MSYLPQKPFPDKFTFVEVPRNTPERSWANSAKKDDLLFEDFFAKEPSQIEIEYEEAVS